MAISNKKKIILGLAAAAAIAAPLALSTSANAAVAVDNGIGHVDKGDIQSSSVLDLNNDAFQTAAAGGKITFSATVNHYVDYEMTCFPTGGTMHRIITQPRTVSIEAKPDTNKQGKILGFDLTGKTAVIAVNGSKATMADTACPEGGFPWMNVGAPTQYDGAITGGLQVNYTTASGTKVVDLPNTPVVALAAR